EMLAAGHESFYDSANGALRFYDPVGKAYVSEPANEHQISLRRLKSSGNVVRENRGASLIDLGDGVACLEFHTKMNTLDADIRQLMSEAIAEIGNGDWRGG